MNIELMISRLIGKFKHNYILFSIVGLLILVEVLLGLLVGYDSKTLVMNIDLSYIAFSIITLSFLISEDNKKIGVLFLTIFQIIVGFIYGSHLPGTGNLILMLFHFTLAPIIYFHWWIENQLDDFIQKQTHATK